MIMRVPFFFGSPCMSNLYSRKIIIICRVRHYQQQNSLRNVLHFIHLKKFDWRSSNKAKHCKVFSRWNNNIWDTSLSTEKYGPLINQSECRIRQSHIVIIFIINTIQEILAYSYPSPFHNIVTVCDSNIVKSLMRRK